MVRVVKDHYIAVAVDSRELYSRNGNLADKFKDDEADFVRAANCLATSASGAAYVVSASGKNLGEIPLHVGLKNLSLIAVQKHLETWKTLPQADRQPKLPDSKGPSDPRRLIQEEVPPNGLIVRIYNRHLNRNPNGELRYTLPADYTGLYGRPSYAREPHHDFMWILEAEWKALVPVNPKKGGQVKVPPTLANRILKYHLEPVIGFGGSPNFINADKAEWNQLSLTIEDVSAQQIRLCLQGNASLSRDRINAGLITYKPYLLGYLDYDLSKKAFTRFEVVAFGDQTGRPVGENNAGERLGTNPLGIVYELVVNPTTAERLHPRGSRDDRNGYLGLKK